MRNKLMSFANKTFYDKYIENVDIKQNGEVVFRNTDLSVFYVGSLLTTESKTSMLEDYPYLNVDDLRFSKLYYNLQINKRPEELVPNFDLTQFSIDKLKKISQKKGAKDEI